VENRWKTGGKNGHFYPFLPNGRIEIMDDEDEEEDHEEHEPEDE
jgi:hypothetical protein